MESDRQQFNDVGVVEQPEVPQMSQEDQMNAKILAEMVAAGAERTITIFYENGQVANFPTNLDRKVLESQLKSGNVVLIPEVRQAPGCKDGVVGLHTKNINFWVIRDKSSIVLPQAAGKIQVVR